MNRIKNELEDIQGRLKKPQPNIIQRIAKAMLIYCGIITLIAYVAWLMGIKYFLLPETWFTQNIIILNMIAAILFAVNMFFIISISLDTNIKESLMLTACYIPPYVLSMICIGNNLISTALLPFVYIMGYSIYRRRILKTLKEFAITSGIVYVWQIISVLIKTNVLSISYHNPTIDQLLYYSIDLIILYLLLYATKGVNIYAVLGRKHLDIANPQNYVEKEPDEETKSLMAELKSSPLFIKIRAMAIMLAIQIIQLFFVLAVAAIGSILIEVIIIIPMFWIIRSIIKKCYHSDSLIICSLLSALIFYVGGKITVPTHYSLFFATLVALAIAVSLYLVQYHIEADELAKKQYDTMNAYFERIYKFCFEKHCDKDRLLAVCNANGLSQYDIDMLIDEYCDCLTRVAMNRKYRRGDTRRDVQDILSKMT